MNYLPRYTTIFSPLYLGQWVVVAISFVLLIFFTATGSWAVTAPSLENKPLIMCEHFSATECETNQNSCTLDCMSTCCIHGLMPYKGTELYAYLDKDPYPPYVLQTSSLARSPHLPPPK